MFWGGGSNSGWVWNGDSRGKIKKLLVDIGNKSFSIYISHIIFYSGIYYNIYILLPQDFKESALGIFSQTIFLLAVAYLIGIISNKLIEEPYIKLGKTFRGKEKFYDK